MFLACISDKLYLHNDEFWRFINNFEVRKKPESKLCEKENAHTYRCAERTNRKSLRQHKRFYSLRVSPEKVIKCIP